MTFHACQQESSGPINHSTYHSTECQGGLLLNLHRVEYESTFLQESSGPINHSTVCT